MAEVGDIIRQLRQDRSMTQEELAARAGLKFSLVRSIESGRNQLTSYATRAALSKAFDLPLVELARLLDESMCEAFDGAVKR